MFNTVQYCDQPESRSTHHKIRISFLSDLWACYLYCLQIYILKSPKYNSVVERGVQKTKPKQSITMSLPPKTRNFSGWGEYIVPCKEPYCLCPALCDQTVTRSWNVIYLPQKEVNHKTSKRVVYNKNIL